MKKLLFAIAFFATFAASGETDFIRLPATRDTWVSTVTGEEEGSNGGSPRIKVKGHQEYSILDFDVSSLAGKAVKAASLHIKLAGEERLWSVSVGTIAVEWYEGKATNYEKEPGASSFRWRRYPDVPWSNDEAYGYSDLTSATFGGMGTIWSSADATEPADGWQSIEVSPAVVEARIEGKSFGFVVFDDTGTELERNGDNVDLHLLPNRFAYSREQNAASCPYLLVEVEDVELPSPVKLGQAEVAIVDEFLKFTPEGESVPSVRDGYLVSNVLWNAATRRIDLAGAHGEFIGFQVAVTDAGAKPWQVKMTWNGEGAAPQTTFYRLGKVDTPKGRMPDPALALPADGAVAFEGKTDTVYCELYIPKGAGAEERTGTLELRDGEGQTLALDVALRVWDFSIPDKLSFLPEMNCYSLPENERDYYRLAQLHRTYVNRVPYSHAGNVSHGCAPEWNPKTRSFEWSAWTKRYGPYFDGSAFSDLPRGPVPVESFFLPLFENFPGNIFEGFKGVNEWPDESMFTPEYLKDFDAGVDGFAKKILAEKWKDTLFVFFLNNKQDYKRNGWTSAASPWLLDEPMSGRDFAALAFFGNRFKAALPPEMAHANLRFRADVSRPQWERDYLDSCLDVYVVAGGPMRLYRQLVLERCRRLGRLLYTYGTSSAPHECAYQPVLWTLDAWAGGADGIIPWQTIGTPLSWKEGDELSLFYPAVPESGGKVVPSVRLKAYRRGQQDAEYLNQLVAKGVSRDDLGRSVRCRLALDHGYVVKCSAEDAGTPRYDATSPEDLELFRRDIARRLGGE